MKNIRKGTRGRRRRENWCGKRAGGGESKVFQQHYGPGTKKAVRKRDQREGVKEKVVEQSYAQINKHASKEVRRF